MRREGESTLDRINRLTEERLQLYSRASRRPLSETERQRLKEIERELSALWEARRRERAGRDPWEEWVEKSHRRAA